MDVAGLAPGIPMIAGFGNNQIRRGLKQAKAAFVEPKPAADARP